VLQTLQKSRNQGSRLAMAWFPIKLQIT